MLQIYQPISNTLRYQGYIRTPSLWNGNSVFQLSQLKHRFLPSVLVNIVPDEVRLGKLVEHFAFNELEQSGEFKLLKKNIQVIEDKVTLGELDCLMTHQDQLIHLEIVYKFYLYDDAVGNTELDHWIGPNRNDHLVKKLTKLTSKQLPLIEYEATLEQLRLLGVPNQKIDQLVDFRAQLFLPYGHFWTESELNKDCVYGYYIRLDDLKSLSRDEFYIPSKLDWLIEPHEGVDWLNVHEFKQALLPLLTNKRSPLCWSKTSEGELMKLFVVWWP